ncbi:MAG: vitamin K epoxide reductase family protein [Bacteroidales bacterium]
MVIYKENTRHHLNWPWWRRIMTGLNILALGLGIIMSWHYLAGGSMVGCGGGSPCEKVLNSKWSTIAGIIPISGLAVGVYLAMLVAGLFIGPSTESPVRRLAWSVMLILAGSIAGSAIWFTIVQKWIIGDFCPYCMATHITGLSLALLVIWRSVTDSSRDILRSLPAMGRVLIGFALAGILVAFQVGFTPSAVYTGGDSQDNLPAIDYHAVPMAGSPDAPYIVTLLFDYQCSHCQKIHFMLDEVIRRYNGKLAFALCPSPLNTKCNPYIPRDVDQFKNSCDLAKIGLAVWVADRSVFPAFENWMFTFESGDGWRPRTPEGARAKAVELVGETRFEAAISDPWIGEYLQASTQIYGQTLQAGRGGIPKLIFGPHWVIPEPDNAEDLLMILQKSLSVPAP